MLLLDLTHTSHTRARTGIQRLARALHRNLGANAVAITHDPFAQIWRRLETWESTGLGESQGGPKRKAQWPASARWRGRLRRLLGRARSHALAGEFSGLIQPELFSPTAHRAFPNLFQRVRGPRIALFMDAIPLRFPELTPPKTVARFPAYLRELLIFDGIAAISEESRDSLLRYWHWLGVSQTPPVFALPLGVDPVTSQASPSASPAHIPVALCVGTLEGRKNHAQLFEACERLWAQTVSFELRVIGHVNHETGGAALARLRSLQAAGRPLRYDGPATDDQINHAYAECAFTIYPSIAEGFGLPVIESLARGKPCVCSGRGALGEISLHGGCIALESVEAGYLADAIRSLVEDPATLSLLSAAARERTFKSWADYTRELVAWMQSLPHR